MDRAWGLWVAGGMGTPRACESALQETWGRALDAARRGMLRVMAAEPESWSDAEEEKLARPAAESSSGGVGAGGEPTLDGAFSPDGVDLTVIRWMLERTSEERLLAAQQLIDAAWALRGDKA